MKARKGPVFLLALPLATYLSSYLYLAWYHQSFRLWNLIVHESGKLTFYQDLFYSSHFLGHLPVHLTLGLFLIGAFMWTAPTKAQERKKAFILGLATLAFLGFCLLHSLWEFGPVDTWDYILQRKQGADRFGEGGSWKLHLVSTLSLPFLMPAYLLGARWLSGMPATPNGQSWPWWLAGVTALFLFSILLEGKGLFALASEAFADNRYLAHSVRELATFSLIYFPPALYLLFRLEGRQAVGERPQLRKEILPVLLLSGALFLALLSYQAYFPLVEGIGSLAQKPAFARGGELSIPYLLASHFFEHFLDTVFFTLFTGFAFCWTVNRVKNR